MRIIPKIASTLLLTACLFACKEDCVPFEVAKEYNEVCSFLSSKEVTVGCAQSVTIEGKEMGIVGKLDPDFKDYLNNYSPTLVDTWTIFFKILDSQLTEKDEINTSKVNETLKVDVQLKHDGKNLQSFEPLKLKLEALLKDKGFRTIKVKGTVKGYNRTTMGGCTKSAVLVIDDINDVVIQ